MKKYVLLAALAVALPASAQTAFSVNGHVISAAAQKELMGVMAARGVKSPEQQLELARQILTERAVISQLAAKSKIDQNPQIKAQIDDSRNQILLNELLRREVFINPITEFEVKKAYEDAKLAYDPNEVKVRHILVRTDPEAKAVLMRLRNGENFAQLAKEHSLDRQTAEKGGEMPFTNVRSITIPGFAEATMALPKGGLLPIPFKSQMGYHVVQLDDKREVPFPSYEQLKPQLERSLIQKRTQDYIDARVGEAQIAEVKQGAQPQAKNDDNKDRDRAPARTNRQRRPIY